MLIPLSYPLILSVLLFALGMIAFFVRRSMITVFMSAELMLNACNLSFIAFARAFGQLDGQIMVIFIMAVAGAEAAVGLAIMIYYIRNNDDKSGMVEQLP